MFLTDKFCFVNIPKNASRSILSKLDELTLKRINTDYSNFLSYWSNKKKIPFSFTLVRNPYNRVLSSYNHAKRENWIGEKISLLQYLQLLKILYIDYNLINEEYIFSDKNILLNVWKSIKKNIDISLEILELIIDHSYPQYKYFTNLDGKVLVDFLLHYENLEKDWVKLYQIFNDKFDIQLEKIPIINENNDSFFISAENELFILKYNEIKINEEEKKIIQEIYNKDFEILNYDKNIIYQRKDIAIKFEKNLNNSYFKLLENEFDKNIRYNLFLELYKNIMKNLPEESLFDKYKKKIIEKKNNNEKIKYLLNECIYENFHFFKKFVINIKII